MERSAKLRQLSTYWQHFVKYRPLIRELVSRDLKVKYRRSFLSERYGGISFSRGIPLLFRADIDSYLGYF